MFEPGRAASQRAGFWGKPTRTPPVASDAPACDVTGVSGSGTANGVLAVERVLAMLTSGSTAPALVEAADGRRFVLKLRGSGVGPRSLAAEYVAGRIARRLGLSAPAVLPMSLPGGVADQVAHAELSDLLRRSVGLNLGVAYLEGAEEPARFEVPIVNASFASRVVWLDAFMKNVDRTARNANLMIRDGTWWVIDHGSCRVFEDSALGFALVREHLLLHRASALSEVDAIAHSVLSRQELQEVVASVPEEWWEGAPPGDVLAERFEHSREFLWDVERHRREPPPPIGPQKDRRPAWARRPSGT